MANNPNVLDNLKPFKKGKDWKGNAKGNYKGTEHSSVRLRRLLDMTQMLTNPINGITEGFTVAEQMDLQQILLALKGDTKAYQTIIDRLEGKPRESIDHTTKGKELPSPILGGISKKTDK